MLSETATLPTAEIAARTDYYDQSALTHRLKVTRGATPVAVRH